MALSLVMYFGGGTHDGATIEHGSFGRHSASSIRALHTCSVRMRRPCFAGTHGDGPTCHSHVDRRSERVRFDLHRSDDERPPAG